MEGSRKLKITLSILFVLILGIASTTFVILSDREKRLENDAVLGQTDMASVPYIISLPPVVGYAGVEYVYDVKYTDNNSDSKDIVVSLDESPAWLHIQDRHIFGIPPLGTSGQFKFDVRISDGKDSSIQENYILIQNNETE